MTVKELIDQLKEADQDLIVMTHDLHYYDKVEIKKVRVFNTFVELDFKK